MFKQIQILVLLFFVAGITYGAAPTGIDSQRLKPSLGLKGMIATDNTEVLDLYNFGAMIYFHYDKAPFNLKKGDDTNAIVDNVIYSDIILSMSVFKNLEIGLDLPLSIFSDGENDGETFSGFSLGDIRLGVKYVMPIDKKLGIGFKLDAYLPTGDVEKFNSSDGFNLQPGVLVDYKINKKLLVAFNLSYLFKVGDIPEVENGIRMGDEISYKLGAKYVINDDVEVFSELLGAFQAKSPFASREETPLEILLAANYYIMGDIRITGGVAGGLSPGVGTPLFRVLLGAGYVQRDPDRDKDGILNADDKCPNKAEDKDGFEDADGCPDLDNDKDGILDADDKCPLKAENVNGFEDADGCPELDTDNDGIFDSVDKCPKKAEDKDGFEDKDGCPDLDNDKDGVLDKDDKCPNVAEDKDNFEDADGCPDPDNDKDGFLDSKDKCPNEPETYNGNQDEDGCPDKGKELVKIDLKTKQIRILKKVFFRTGSAKILRKSYKLLDIVAGTLNSHPDIKKIEVQGHTDDVGRDKSNKRLSQKRANSVMKYLVKKKVAKERLTAVGYGKDKPMVEYKQLKKDSRNKKIKWKKRKAIRKQLKKARSDNRRVEFKILSE